MFDSMDITSKTNLHLHRSDIGDPTNIYPSLSVQQSSHANQDHLMSSSMATEVHHLHFLLIPLMSQSHIIPLTDFAKLLTVRGVIVSIISTPLNAIRYEGTIERSVEAGMKIRMIPLQFPGQEVGLPQGCENMDTLTSMDLTTEFFSACEMLKTPLEILIEEMEPKPNCIIATNALPWTQEIATKFNVPRYVFETISCFTLLCSRKLSQAASQGNGIQDSEPFQVPDIPHEVEFTKSQLPETMRKSSDSFKAVLDQIITATRSARGTLVNSFEELEPWYVEENKKGRQNFWCIGPVSLCNTNFAEKSDRGNKASVDEHNCISWLDSMEPGSVIYVCFGSLCRISAAQIKEIGLGLEASNYPFVWIIRGLDCSGEVEKWLREQKFEERVKGRGLIIRGWAPQVLILSHPSMGGFMTHCGWNSTLEGISAGVPMITWPMFAEQFYNEKFIVNVLEIGVRVGVEVGTKTGAHEERHESFVTRDQVHKSVERLMAETEEGKERRKRAQRLGEKAKGALGQEGSSNLNISLLIQDVMKVSIQ